MGFHHSMQRGIALDKIYILWGSRVNLEESEALPDPHMYEIRIYSNQHQRDLVSWDGLGVQGYSSLPNSERYDSSSSAPRASSCLLLLIQSY